MCVIFCLFLIFCFADFFLFKYENMMSILYTMLKSLLRRICLRFPCRSDRSQFKVIYANYNHTVCSMKHYGYIIARKKKDEI